MAALRLPVTLALHPSRGLALLLIAAHSVALLAVCLLTLAMWFKLPLLLGIVVSLWRSLGYLHGPRRIVLLTLRDEEVLEYIRLNNETGEARIHPHSTVTPLLTLLLLKQENRLEPLVLLQDSLNQEDFRRLRLWLRWQAASN